MWNLGRSTGDAMELKGLLRGFRPTRLQGDAGIHVTALAYHTDQVTPGCCFVAVRGLQTDGHRFVHEAVRRGAKAILVEEDLPVPRGIVKLVVPDSRDALARLSANFFGEPTLRLHLVGITGTNGKTTVAFLLDQIARAAGRKTGLLTTVGYRWGETRQAADRTTPESYLLQKNFRAMVDEGVEHCFMEVTSHALALKRVVGCHFDGALFTNLSVDHLDFHRDLESYFAEKAKLFRERLVVSAKKNLWAVLNGDDPYGRTLGPGLPARVWRYSLSGQGEVFTRRVAFSWEGSTIEAATPQGDIQLTSPLFGDFNASNILAALAASLAMEMPLDAIRKGVAAFQGVPGRLERIPNSRGLKIIVDYAHTPAALENVLQTLRTLGPRRLITVFGCGGNRDRGKRPQMGEIAERYSDQVIVTSDNPRFEEPEIILNEIQQGMRQKEKGMAIVDRREAITHALSLAQPGDCLLVAGKGHETEQEIRGVRHPFSDREIIQEWLHGV